MRLIETRRAVTLAPRRRRLRTSDIKLVDAFRTGSIAIPGPPFDDGKSQAMLFHVKMIVRIPSEIDPEVVKALSAKEHERAAALQREGTWLHLWRIVGQYANVSIFKVESAEELHDILFSLPLHPFMEVEVTSLCRHPGSLAPD